LEHFNGPKKATYEEFQGLAVISYQVRTLIHLKHYFAIATIKKYFLFFNVLNVERKCNKNHFSFLKHVALGKEKCNIYSFSFLKLVQG